jgi:hypothetical protein
VAEAPEEEQSDATIEEDGDEEDVAFVLGRVSVDVRDVDVGGVQAGEEWLERRGRWCEGSWDTRFGVGGVG